MAERKDISTKDRDLFRNSVGAVDRIKHDPQHLPDRKSYTLNRPPPPGIKSDPGNPSVNREYTDPVGMGDALNFCRPGIQHRILSRLKKGQYPIEDELNLHGLRGAEAEKRLLAFLDYCQQEAIQCIRIIHGKGRGSRDQKPVIKNMLNSKLRNRRDVLAFTSAPVRDGGTGAIYVLLKNG